MFDLYHFLSDFLCALINLTMIKSGSLASQTPVYQLWCEGLGVFYSRLLYAVNKTL